MYIVAVVTSYLHWFCIRGCHSVSAQMGGMIVLFLFKTSSCLLYKRVLTVILKALSVICVLQAFDDANAILNDSKIDSHKDSTLIMQLLHDNLTVSASAGLIVRVSQKFTLVLFL